MLSLEEIKFFLGTSYKLYIKKCVLLETKQFCLIFTSQKQSKHSILGVYSCKNNTKVYEKYMNTVFGDQFYQRCMLKCLNN